MYEEREEEYEPPDEYDELPPLEPPLSTRRAPGFGVKPGSTL